MTSTTHTFRYRNITISGLPGCGSTTLLNLLREKLKFDGWKGFSGGEFMRAYAEEKGLFEKKGELHHDASHYEDDFDHQVDYGMREKLATQEKWIIESWLSGFLAQGVPNVLKVLMVCSDDAVRIDRIVNRDSVTADDAKANMAARYDNNFKKWSRIYSPEWQDWVVGSGKTKTSDPIDFWRRDLYDCVIDTYDTNRQQTIDLVLEKLQTG